MGHELDRFGQVFIKLATPNILNMYRKQVECAEAILDAEEKYGLHFFRIINTREDVYFFNRNFFA
jgi:hypothetical protein